MRSRRNSALCAARTVIRKALGRMAGSKVSHDTLSEVLTVLVDRIANFEALIEARFDGLTAPVSRFEIAMRLLVLATLLGLAGCKSQAERDASFIRRCEAARFTYDQCAFLLALAKDQKSDSDDAVAMSAAAVGIATSAAVRR